MAEGGDSHSGGPNLSFEAPLHSDEGNIQNRSGNIGKKSIDETANGSSNSVLQEEYQTLSFTSQPRSEASTSGNYYSQRDEKIRALESENEMLRKQLEEQQQLNAAKNFPPVTGHGIVVPLIKQDVHARASEPALDINQVQRFGTPETILEKKPADDSIEVVNVTEDIEDIKKAIENPYKREGERILHEAKEFEVAKHYVNLLKDRADISHQHGEAITDIPSSPHNRPNDHSSEVPTNNDALEKRTDLERFGQ